MELTGWYAGLIIASMCFLYIGGIVSGFLAMYIYMIFRGARAVAARKERMDEVLSKLEDREPTDEAFVVYPGTLVDENGATKFKI